MTDEITLPQGRDLCQRCGYSGPYDSGPVDGCTECRWFFKLTEAQARQVLRALETVKYKCQPDIRITDYDEKVAIAAEVKYALEIFTGGQPTTPGRKE